MEKSAVKQVSMLKTSNASWSVQENGPALLYGCAESAAGRPRKNDANYLS